MGNQLTARAPAQILNVESYLSELSDLEFVSSLGSTRFFKVAKANNKEGSVVIKVFAINDPSLLLKEYKVQVDHVQSQLLHATNCLPYQRTTIPPELSERAAFLFRQYIKDNLYDRISTRPFLIPIEKKWITFQLLCALNQCHKSRVCHGDIKSENVLVTSWNWVFLADFASFKPTFMSCDNPEDFNFFFDTSRRRVCNIAPERFLASSSGSSHVRRAGEMDLLQGTDTNGGSDRSEGFDSLEPSMDIFSAGCVIAELFTEGVPLFDYAELLAFSVNQHNPNKVIDKIEDPHIRELVKRMTQQNPRSRSSADEYLVQEKGRAFPEYFYTYLKLYLQRFVVPPMVTKDDLIMRLKRDLKMILQGMEVDEGKTHEENSGLVIIISLITSSQRNLFHQDSKIAALDLLSRISCFVAPEIILDRILPFLLFMVGDSFPRVRAKAIKAMTHVLSLVRSLPRGESNVFPEYIFPAIIEVAQDEVVCVRVAFAESLSSLAESSLRFLEMADQTPSSPNHADDKSPAGAGATGAASDLVSGLGSIELLTKSVSAPDSELNALHEFFQAYLVSLLTDSENIVRRSLVENGLARLCVFFGRQKANDVVLSHLITFLNDKNDWQLRAAFYSGIAGVNAFVGSQAASMLKPLLLQGLGDSEDAVISTAIKALTDMTEAGLVQKPLIQELMAEVVPFLCHPNIWLRQGAVGFVCCASRSMSKPDVHCHLLPVLKPFLVKNVIQIDKEFVLLSVLVDPVPQNIYDWIIRSFSSLTDFIDYLQDRQLVRNLTRKGQVPAYGEAEDASLLQLFKKLVNFGLTEDIEDQILRMKDFLIRRNLHERSIHNAIQDSTASSTDDAGAGIGAASAPGVINLEKFPGLVTRRADLNLLKSKDNIPRLGPGVSPRISRQSRSPVPASQQQKESRDASQHDDPRKIILSDPQSVGVTTPSLALESREGTPNPRISSRGESPAVPNPHQIKYPQCRHDLHQLVVSRREQYAFNQTSRDLLEGRLKQSKTPPHGWKPKGKLVAHIHEHRMAINRVVVDGEHRKMATCSNDGTTKIFDATKLDGKSATNRSKMTYNKQGGKIKSVAFVQSGTALATASDSGSIHVVNIDRNSLSVGKEIDLSSFGHVVDLNHFDSVTQNVIAYCTVNGHILGWDLRMPDSSNCWSLANDAKLGLITSFAIDPKQNWIAVGTSAGNIVCWDMRFQLPITNISHPTDARVRKLILHPTEPSWIISANQGNNEISFWDMETGHRQVTFWASTAPALSQTQATHHFVQGMYCAANQDYVYLLSAGSDMRVRLWDISNPKDSYIMTRAAGDPANHAVVSYQTKIIEGTSVHQEMYSKQRGASTLDDAPRGSSGSYLDAPSAGHHDVITDIDVVVGAQSLVLTSSRDGVVKVWK